MKLKGQIRTTTLVTSSSESEDSVPLSKLVSQKSSEDSDNVPLSKLVSQKSSDDSDELPLSVVRNKDKVPLSVPKNQNSTGNSNKSGRRFKCKFCVAVRHSQKDLNNHHKQSHGKLNCPECDEVYDTPSGLHRHSYRHKELKFKCPKCSDKFPFQSQLDDHLIKHIDERAHSCNSCTKRFKNASSLRKHALVHDGRKHHCNHKKCDYWSYDKRNLDAHRYSNHSKKDRYGCDKCGETFKHHTQMGSSCRQQEVLKKVK